MRACVKSSRFSMCLKEKKNVVRRLLTDSLTILPVKSRFVWAVVKDLEELGPTQMKHKLGVQRKVLSNDETIGIVFRINAKFLTLQKHK